MGSRLSHESESSSCPATALAVPQRSRLGGRCPSGAEASADSCTDLLYTSVRAPHTTARRPGAADAGGGLKGYAHAGSTRGRCTSRALHALRLVASAGPSSGPAYTAAVAVKRRARQPHRLCPAGKFVACVWRREIAGRVERLNASWVRRDTVPSAAAQRVRPSSSTYRVGLHVPGALRSWALPTESQR